MKKIWIFFVFMLLALMIFSACSTSTKGRSPADGEWDHVQFWNGGTLIWENEEGVVKIDSQESINHSNGTWMQYSVTNNKKTIYILDCESLTIIYYND